MKFGGLYFAVLLFVGALFSQQGYHGPGPPPTGDTDLLKTYLALSDQQLQDLTSLQSSFREAADPIMQQSGEKSQALRQALQSNPVDQTLVSQLQADLDSLRTQLNDLRSQYRTQAQAILTDQQKTSLAVLQQALDLMPTAQQATSLNLLDGPNGPWDGPGGPPPH